MKSLRHNTLRFATAFACVLLAASVLALLALAAASETASG